MNQHPTKSSEEEYRMYGERREGKLLELVKQMDRAGERGIYIVHTGKYISTQSFLFRMHFPLHRSDSFLGS
jgi:hypothetical protein